MFLSREVDAFLVWSKFENYEVRVWKLLESLVDCLKWDGWNQLVHCSIFPLDIVHWLVVEEVTDTLVYEVGTLNLVSVEI